MEQGLGHQPENGVSDDAMAVFCPACPQPGINLPKDWHTKYRPYVTTLDHDRSKRLTAIHLTGTNLSGHSSWMETFLRSI